MIRKPDLFDMIDRDMAVALMNLCAARMCASSGALVTDLLQDVQKHLMGYANCSEEDIVNACKKYDGFVERA